jgi:hypothetical protein
VPEITLTTSSRSRVRNARTLKFGYGEAAGEARVPALNRVIALFWTVDYAFHPESGY